jgi:small subunit ribosomal protein S27e
MKQIRVTASKFVRVKCPKCENEQVIFGKATTTIKCIKCDQILARPSSGKAKIKAKVLEVCK